METIVFLLLPYPDDGSSNIAPKIRGQYYLHVTVGRVMFIVKD